MIENLEWGFSLIVQVEGDEYTDDPNDPGGPTKYGVTLETARKLGFDKDLDGDVDAQDVMLLSKGDAHFAFKTLYWDKVNADALPDGNDIMAADLAYNSGVGRVKELYDENLHIFINNRWRYFLYLANQRQKFQGFFRGWCNRLNIIVTSLEERGIL
jgi:lysozyme family protein